MESARKTRPGGGGGSGVCLRIIAKGYIIPAVLGWDLDSPLA